MLLTCVSFRFSYFCCVSVNHCWWKIHWKLSNPMHFYSLIGLLLLFLLPICLGQGTSSEQNSISPLIIWLLNLNFFETKKLHHFFVSDNRRVVSQSLSLFFKSFPSFSRKTMTSFWSNHFWCHRVCYWTGLATCNASSAIHFSCLSSLHRSCTLRLCHSHTVW
jgi:hypothetical protein